MGKSRQSPQTYSAEFKAAAVQRARTAVAHGRTQSSVDDALDVDSGVLSNWIRAAISAGTLPAVEPGESPEAELRRLRREVELLRPERDFAKEAAAYFTKAVE